MPLPLIVCLAFASGAATALAGRAELRVSPRAALLTQAFAAYQLFVVLLLLPATAYFYVFHADWFLLYLVDPRDIPSALALLGLLAIGGIGALGFLAGASLVRSQREAWAGGLAAALALLGLGVSLGLGDRLRRVGTYVQFHRGFGLTDYGDGPLYAGTLSLGLLMVLGLVFLLVRLELSHRTP